MRTGSNIPHYSAAGDSMKTIGILFHVLLIMCLVTLVGAQTEDLPDGPRGPAFRETTTGKIWLKVNNFTGLTYDQVVQQLQGSPFRLATKGEVERLYEAAGNHFVGGTPDRCSIAFNCIRGFYDDSLTGESSDLVGLAEQAETIIMPEFGSGVRDDAAPSNTSGRGAYVIQRFPVLQPASSALSQDFDGDNIEEKAVWRNSNGMWFIRLSATNEVLDIQWGLPGDKPLIGDYDGDGVPDIAVYRPTTSTWFIKTSSSLYDDRAAITQQFGLPGDVPVRADYDADNRLDLTVWRPTSGTYFYLKSTTAEIVSEQWGLVGDVPVGAIPQ
jgi:hypothetical protein